MSRFDSDMDHADWLNGFDQLTAICDDCGAAFFTRDDDPAYWCAACLARRDAHTDALQHRLTEVVLAQLKVALASSRKTEGAA